MISLKRLTGYVLLIGVFVGAFYAVNRSQDIIDWWKLRDYEPPARIAEISEAVSFNEFGERLFYVNDPKLIMDKAEFAESCRTSNEIIVLGCHITNQNIFIYDVQDGRLDGIIEVTAAHEMLHAAYDRLSLNEKERIDRLLQQEYDQIKQVDDRLRRTLESYAERDPSVVPNELHSILGTEVRDLPAPLEEYYSKYFDDRQAVVAFAEAYEDEFIARETQLEAYDDELERLNGEIVRLEADIALQSQALQSERVALESQRGNPEAFNAGVPGFNTNVAALNADIGQLRVLIEEYNAVVEDRNELAVEERELVEAIDSRIESL